MNTQSLKISSRVRAWPVAVPIALFALALVLSGKTSLIFALFVAIVGGLTVVTIAPEKLLALYFVYLVFEGAFKIWTNYNPVVHVGSDLILVVVTLRLMYRFHREPELFPKDPIRNARFAAVVKFLTLFWVWVVLQFVNPWGLGVLPSIAGLKVYVMPVMVFFCVGYLLRDGEWERLPFIVLCIGTFEGFVAVCDWLVGPFGLASLNPKYAETVFNYLKGSPYRPFGTTHLPGTPGVWMYHTAVGAVLSFYLLRDGVRARPNFWKTLGVLFAPLAVMTLIVCQIRLIIIRTSIVCISAAFFAGRKYALIAAVFFTMLLSAYYLSPRKGVEEDTVQHSTLKDRLLQAVSRARTLERGGTWSQARGGWAWRELFRRARFSMTGVGLSRVGAASSPWHSIISRDRLFGEEWSFADNVFLAVFTELGIGGIATYLLLQLAIAVTLLSCGNRVASLCMINCLAMLFSGYASEGILYQPDASFFWLYAAIGLRYRPRKGDTEVPAAC